MTVNPQMLTAYLNFVVERHAVWEERQQGAPAPWTSDPILQQRKFTNVYRVLDHGSQFLLEELLNDPLATERTVLARAFLYRMTNRPEPWLYAKEQLGQYPDILDLFNLGQLWAGWRDAGNQVFSGAYIIMPEPGVPGVDKVRSVVRLARKLFGPESTLPEQFLAAGSMAERFALLRAQKGVGDFIAMQVLTDFGYSRYGADQDENEFVIAGPGARNGGKHIFPGVKPADAILRARAWVLAEPEVPSLYGREPSLMDIQNTLCEFSKYARFMGAPPRAKTYAPAHPGPQPAPTLPAHWGLTV